MLAVLHKPPPSLKNGMPMKSILFACAIFIASTAFCQDYRRFEAEVKQLTDSLEEKAVDAPIVFAGSSSIRFWDTSRYFPDVNIVNHGFGGSETSDLVCYVDDLILSVTPSQIFVYEGDNDLSSGKSIEIVVADMKTLLRILKRNLPDTPIHIISPKPSIARWNLRKQYVELNKELQALCESKELVTFIDVWNPMLDEKGKLKKDLFIEDGLHMNDAGYDIWTAAIRPHLN